MFDFIIKHTFIAVAASWHDFLERKKVGDGLYVYPITCFLFHCLGIHGKVITANRACPKWGATTEIPIVYQGIMAWMPLGEPSLLNGNLK